MRRVESIKKKYKFRGMLLQNPTHAKPGAILQGVRLDPASFLAVTTTKVIGSRIH